MQFGPFSFDLGARSLHKSGQELPLTTGEFAMLKALVRHPRQPMSREKLAQLARGREFEPFDRSLDVQISRLRKMIEADPASPRYIQTVWGVGYVFVPDGAAPERGGNGSGRPAQPMPLRPATFCCRRTRRGGFGLFGRTFFLLAALLLVSILAWLQTLRVFELEPRAVQTAQQIASIVNLSRAALIHSDSIARVSLIKTMTEQEAVRILPREPGDRFEPFPDDDLGLRMTQELAARLGADTVVANSVNDEPGLWIGFTIDEDRYWMLTDRARLNPPVGKTWIIWLVTAAALSLAGAALIAGLINRPLKDLSVAAGRVREGDFAAGHSGRNRRRPTRSGRSTSSSTACRASWRRSNRTASSCWRASRTTCARRWRACAWRPN